MLLKALIVSLIWTDWYRHTSSLIELSQKTKTCPRKQEHVLENKNNLPSQATRLALFCGAFLLLSQKWISKQGERIVWRNMIFLFDFQYILGNDLLNIVDILHKIYTFTLSRNGSKHRGKREFRALKLLLRNIWVPLHCKWTSLWDSRLGGRGPLAMSQFEIQNKLILP